MKILITGGTGFIGSALINILLEQGEEITLLTRQQASNLNILAKVTMISTDPVISGPWQDKIKDHNCFINLAGAQITNRWTKKFKKELHDSRIKTTRNLVQAIANSPNPSEKTFISASAVGYYGFHNDELIDENTPPGKDILANLASEWEREAYAAEKYGTRVITCRFGVVFGKDGGVLSHMLPIFKKAMGGPAGNGKQWVSWIHLKDVIMAMIFLKDTPTASGPFNITSPEPVRNMVLAHTLRKILNIPVKVSIPSIAIKALLGEASSAILKGQRVIPKRLEHLGFKHAFTSIDKCLMDLIK